MKNILIAMALAGSCSLASADNGFHVGFGLGAVGANTKESDSVSDITFGQTSTVGVIDAGYTAQINENWGVGVGATLDTNKSRLGVLSSEVIEQYDLEFRARDHYSVYVQPFLKLTPDTAIFGKLGYHSIKLELASQTAGESFSRRLNGIGYGFGVKTMLTRNTYLQAEAMWVDYRSRPAGAYDYKTKSTAGIVTLGYQFADALPALPASGKPGKGFHAGLGLAAVGAKFSATSAQTDMDVSQSNTLGIVDIGYAAPISQDWSIGLGATFDLNETRAGAINPEKFRARIRNHHSVYIQPLLHLTPDIAVFGKLGYHVISGRVSDDSFARSNRYHGIGYGFGVRTMINRNAYLQAEASWVDYAAQTFVGSTSGFKFDYDFKTTAGIITVGYQF